MKLMAEASQDPLKGASNVRVERKRSACVSFNESFEILLKVVVVLDVKHVRGMFDRLLDYR